MMPERGRARGSRLPAAGRGRASLLALLGAAALLLACNPAAQPPSPAPSQQPAAATRPTGGAASPEEAAAKVLAAMAGGDEHAYREVLLPEKRRDFVWSRVYQVVAGNCRAVDRTMEATPASSPGLYRVTITFERPCLRGDLERPDLMPIIVQEVVDGDRPVYYLSHFDYR